MAKRNRNEETLICKVDRIIERDDATNFQAICTSSEFKQAFGSLAQGYFKHEENLLDLLSLAAFYDSFECFKLAHAMANFSHAQTDVILNEQNTCLLDLVCLRGSKNLIEYFIPFVAIVSVESPAAEKTESLSLNLDEPKVSKKISTQNTSIQKACEHGNINAVSCVYKYFKDKPSVPFQLDLEYQNENYGENCALIACRKVNYLMIKYLHMHCHCNFGIINKQGENALQVLAASNKKKQAKDFHECFVYLVNLVGVDILYNYEETLLLINCYKTIAFFEKKLSEKGINLNKSELEDRNKITRTEHFKSVIEEKIESLQNKNITFCDLYDKVMEKDDDDISSICTENRSGTPFTSIIGNLP